MNRFSTILPTTRLAIGVFDSGLGGLTVMRQIASVLPNESLIYYGDTARVPYGGKSRETIIRYSIENARFLMEQEVKMIVVACNTATAHAIDILREQFAVPIVDVIDPGVAKLVATTKTKQVAVLGTKATISSGIYQKKIEEKLSGASVTALACPLFVPLVEEHWLDHAATDLIIKEYLAPLRHKDIDTLLLGCTHYPLLKERIEKELGEKVTVVDSATTCAVHVAEALKERQIASESTEERVYQYFVSDDPDRFRKMGEHFLGCSIDVVQKSE